MIAVIGQPDGVVRRHVDAVRTLEDALAPRAQEIAGAVEHAHRVLAAVERIDIIVPVDTDRGDIGVEFHARRQLGPPVIDFIAIAIRPEYDRHGISSPLPALQIWFTPIIEVSGWGSTRIGGKTIADASHPSDRPRQGRGTVFTPAHGSGLRPAQGQAPAGAHRRYGSRPSSM